VECGAGVLSYASRQARVVVLWARGDKGSLRRGRGRGRGRGRAGRATTATGQVARITGCYALALLAQHQRSCDGLQVLCRAGGGQELHRSLKGGSHF
jgi:hypothetical protein